LAGNKSDVAKFLSAVKKSAACMETGVSFALPDQPVSEGVSSGALHELLVFAISTLLFSKASQTTNTNTFSFSLFFFAKGYSLVMGHFCLEFNKADPHRPGVLVKVLISNTRAKIETSVATIRGSSNNQLAFVPDAARFALPHCRPCRVRDVTDSLNPNEMLGTKQDLVTYWQSNYGLGSVISESRLFARVVYGTLHFTYPSAALLATALVVDDKHRSGATLEREEKLHERVKRDLEALSILAKRREE
jgi:hypothetical protein